MPKVFEKDGYRFFFFAATSIVQSTSHVRYGAGEAVFDVERLVELRESFGLRVRELSHAEKLAREHQALITEKWHEHLG